MMSCQNRVKRSGLKKLALAVLGELKTQSNICYKTRHVLP